MTLTNTDLKSIMSRIEQIVRATGIDTSAADDTCITDAFALAFLVGLIVAARSNETSKDPQEGYEIMAETIGCAIQMYFTEPNQVRIRA